MNPIHLHTHNWLALKLNNDSLRSRLTLLGGTVYDLGCGNRPYEKDILEHAERYVGVDWSATLHSRTADIEADLNLPIPVEDGVADAVVSLSVLEHLRSPQTMLAEAARILRPGGALVLQVPWQWWVHEAPYDFFRYTPHALRFLLVDAGFEQIDIAPQCGIFSTLFLKLNYFSTRFIRGPRALRALVRCVLTPFWFISQLLAPLLDRLDRDWPLETTGFCVTARRQPMQQTNGTHARIPIPERGRAEASSLES